MKNVLFFTYTLILLATQVGCERTRRFDIAVGNRLDYAKIMVEMDGRGVGTVNPGESHGFTVEVEIRDNSPTSYGGSGRSTNYADVTIWARNLKTRKLSKPTYRRLYTDRVTSVTFGRNDF